MKNPARLIAALIIVAAVVVVLVLSFNNGSRPDTSVGDRVRSEDGTAELVQFFALLADERYVDAAQYIEVPCQGSYCFTEAPDRAAVAVELETLCVDHLCQAIEIDTVGEDRGSNVRSHEMAFVGADGKREPFCMDTDCSVQKLTSQFRVRRVGDLWYVVDAPSLRVQ